MSWGESMRGKWDTDDIEIHGSDGEAIFDRMQNLIVPLPHSLYFESVILCVIRVPIFSTLLFGHAPELVLPIM